MVNRKLWTDVLSKDYAPSWPCPTCSRGNYSLIPNSLISKETTESKRNRDEPDWEPDSIEYIFSAWLKCNTCDQEAAISGKSSWTQDEDGHLVTIYLPLFCYPMPDIMVISTTWPKPIIKELRTSFLHFWADRSAAANRLRVAIERLMDHYRVKKYFVNKRGDNREYSLHQRIGFFSERHPNIGKLLLSIKWLGNTGSHDSDISVDDLLDGYEIIEHALGELIDKRLTKLETKAKKLIRKHKNK